MGPQCEDGYTKIANELLEALCQIRIPGESMQIFLTILRKTYGYGKKEDRIALSQFVEATGVSKTHVLRAIDKLVDMNIVTKNGNGYIVSYGINKIYQEWKPLPKKGTFPKKVIIVTNKGNKRTPKRDIQKKKENKERGIIPPPIESVIEYCLQRNRGVDPEKWYDHYTSNGWKVGKTKMVDWRAAVRTWERNQGGTTDDFKERFLAGGC